MENTSQSDCCFNDNDREFSVDDYFSREGSEFLEEDPIDALADRVERNYFQLADRRFRAMHPRVTVRRVWKDTGVVVDTYAHLSPIPAASPSTTSGLSSAPVDTSSSFSFVTDSPAVIVIDPASVRRIVGKHWTSMAQGKPARLSPDEERSLVNAYQHMLAVLSRCQSIVATYHGSSYRDWDPLKVPLDSVPTYYANVGGESAFYRKALSICGLRNLIHFGPLVYQQLQSKLFLGDPNVYAANEGLSLMRRVTGNTVDLDTVVLRCTNVTLQLINRSNAHQQLPTFASTQDFGDSQQAHDIAIHSAQLAIDEFTKVVKMAQNERSKRRIQLTTPYTIPIARDNTDRGKYPLWRYMNCGVDSYHANVPHMPDVVGALLRAPLKCIELYSLLFTGAFGPAPPTSLDRDAPCELSPATQQLLLEFFDNCVSDSCFNGKWKAIEEFEATLQHKGTIADVLQRLQQEHQHKFTAELFDGDDAEHSNEAALLLSLCQGQKGRDGSGTIRSITESDVKAFVSSY